MKPGCRTLVKPGIILLLPPLASLTSKIEHVIIIHNFRN